MKKFLLSTAAVLLAAPALAADLPRRAPAAAPVPVFTQAFSWQGLYVGAQVGYAWGESDVGVFNATPAGLGAAALEPNGLLAGLHAGYNWQRGSLVSSSQTRSSARELLALGISKTGVWRRMIRRGPRNHTGATSSRGTS